MNRKAILSLLLLIGLIQAVSASGIKVYVAEAAEAGISIDKELTPISKHLKRTRFKSFKYVGSSAKHNFPVKFEEMFKNGLKVSCDGPAHRLKVIIKYKNKVITEKVLKIEQTFVIGIPISGKNYLVVLQH